MSIILLRLEAATIVRVAQEHVVSIESISRVWFTKHVLLFTRYHFLTSRMQCFAPKPCHLLMCTRIFSVGSQNVLKSHQRGAGPSWSCRLLPFLPVDPHTTIGGGRISQTRRRTRSQLDIDSSTSDIDCSLVGGLQICTGSAYGLIR